MYLKDRCVLEADCCLWEIVVIEDFYLKDDIFPVLYSKRVENQFGITKKMNLIDIKYWFGYRGMALGYLKNDHLYTVWINKQNNDDYIMTIIRDRKNENNCEVFKLKNKLENKK